MFQSSRSTLKLAMLQLRLFLIATAIIYWPLTQQFSYQNTQWLPFFQCVNSIATPQTRVDLWVISHDNHQPKSIPFLNRKEQHKKFNLIHYKLIFSILPWILWFPLGEIPLAFWFVYVHNMRSDLLQRQAFTDQEQSTFEEYLMELLPVLRCFAEFLLICPRINTIRWYDVNERV